MPTEMGHAGDISPAEAMAMVSGPERAILVDVRTVGEWETIGVPDLATVDAKPIFVEWATAPSMAPNPAFVDHLEAELKARGADAATPLLFLCRSGARSTAAARTMTALGHVKSYNVEGGFEGSPGAGLPGWRRSGLPSAGD